MDKNIMSALVQRRQGFGVHTRPHRCSVVSSAPSEKHLLQHATFRSRRTLTDVIKGHEGCINTIVWNASETLLLSGSDDCHINLWSSLSRSLQAGLYTGHRRNIFGAKFVPSSGDKQIITTAADGEVRFHDIGEGDIRSRVLQSSFGMTIKSDFHPESPHIFITSSTDHTVRLFDLRLPQSQSQKVLCSLRQPITSAAFDPFHIPHFAVGSDDQYLRIYDLRSSRPYPTNLIDPNLEAWSIKELDSVNCVGSTSASGSSRLEAGISCVEYSRFTPGELLVNYRKQPAFLYSTTQRKILQKYTERTNAQTFAKEIAFLNGGACVATGSDDGLLYIWEKTSGRLLQRLRADSCIVNCIAAQLHAPVVAVSGIDSSAKLFEYRGELPFDETAFAREFTTPPGGKAGTESAEESDPAAETELELRQRMESSFAIIMDEDALGRLSSAQLLKAEGNDLFKQTKPQEALLAYARALELLKFHIPSRSVGLERRACMISTSLNMAACHIQLRQFGAAIRSCGLVLSVDPANLKAKFRRAQSLFESGDLDAADEAVRALLTADPGDASIVKLSQQVQSARREKAAADKKLYARMFK
eukprot:m.612878 g.612878  ORF g.612878 m.612878 type:complete len:588 (-) comp58147_c0_seq34:82-1845(-)